MAMELDSLIRKIKTEGVEEAKKRSEEIIAQAEEKAREIIKDAESERVRIIKEGQKEVANLKRSGEEALNQASRDLLLTLRQKIIDLFDGVIKEKVCEELSSKNLKNIIAKIIENFKRDEGLDNIEVLLSKDDKKELEAVLLKSLKEKLKEGLTFRVSAGIEKGFRIGEKGKNFYYDFTDDAIAEAFKLYLNPKIAEILKLK